MSKNIIDYVAIFAAGKGTRLEPITNYIPKVLINVMNHTLLFNIIDYWKFYTKNFIIIINSKYYTILTNYLKTLELNDINFIIKIVDIIDQENLFTIKHAIDESFYGKKILFTWCDIYPNELIPLHIFNENIIFTFGDECRYIVKNNSSIQEEKKCKYELIKCLNNKTNGNVIGIFYFQNYNGLIGGNDYNDLCDIYSKNYDIFNIYQLNNLIDVGDMNKLNKYLNNTHYYKTRFFNKIIEENNRLLKISILENGNDIIQKEINWYKNVNFDFIPTIFSYKNNSFIMEKIIASPLYINFWNYNFDKQSQILENIFSKLNILHSKSIHVNDNIFINDIGKELKFKIFNRIEKVYDIIHSFGKIEFVNGIKINQNYKYVINNIYKNVIENFSIKNEYNIIHGDCQFSNTLYNDENDKIWFIDPRGYFGDTKLFGIKEYDYAKIAYSLSGYDNFNNNEKYYIKLIEDNKIELNIEDNFYKFENLFKKYCNVNIVKNIIIINWFGLCQYNQNNILKCISSYYYALYLYEKYNKKD